MGMEKEVTQEKSLVQIGVSKTVGKIVSGWRVPFENLLQHVRNLDGYTNIRLAEIESKLSEINEQHRVITNSLERSLKEEFNESLKKVSAELQNLKRTSWTDFVERTAAVHPPLTKLDVLLREVLSIAAVSARFSSGTAVLELQCEFGQRAGLLLNRGCEYTGLDFLPMTVAQARKRNPSTAVFLSDSEFEEAGLTGRFDAVFVVPSLSRWSLIDMFQHLKRSALFLSDRGMLLCGMPHYTYTLSDEIESYAASLSLKLHNRFVNDSAECAILAFETIKS